MFYTPPQTLTPTKKKNAQPYQCSPCPAEGAEPTLLQKTTSTVAIPWLGSCSSEEALKGKKQWPNFATSVVACLTGGESLRANRCTSPLLRHAPNTMYRGSLSTVELRPVREKLGPTTPPTLWCVMKSVIYRSGTVLCTVNNAQRRHSVHIGTN